jgi:alpha-amylase
VPARAIHLKDAQPQASGGSAQTSTFATGLQPGTYCEIIHGALSHGSGTGPTITVGAGGTASVTVPGKDADAIYGASRPG